MKIHGMTDTGVRRKNNEDSFYISSGPVGMFDALVIVADGMGGHSYGEVASQTAVDVIVRTIQNAPKDNPAWIIEQAASLANLEVWKKSEMLKSSGMGTTMVLAAIADDTAYVANIGDSRLYLIDGNNNSIRQITHDHSYVEEMVAKGLLERGSELYERQKNVITRAIGIYSEVETDQFEVELEKGQYLLLCSDGLSNMVNDIVIKNLVLDDGFTLKQRVESLIREANNKGGRDNITVALIEADGGKTC